MAQCKFLPALSDSLEVTASNDPPQTSAFVGTMEHVLPVFDHLGKDSVECSLQRWSKEFADTLTISNVVQGLFFISRKRT
jgi:hypothetical protein